MKTFLQKHFTICLILFAFGLPALVFLPACETTFFKSEDSRNSAIKVAAYLGTFYAIEEQPELKDEFQLAHKNLIKLEERDVLDIAELIAIMNALPIKELKSDEARIIITASTIFLSESGSVPVSVDLVELRPLITALREGIELGLE